MNQNNSGSTLCDSDCLMKINISDSIAPAYHTFIFPLVNSGATLFIDTNELYRLNNGTIYAGKVYKHLNDYTILTTCHFINFILNRRHSGISWRSAFLIWRDSFESRQHVMISLSDAEFLSLCMIYTVMLNKQKFSMTY